MHFRWPLAAVIAASLGVVGVISFSAWAQPMGTTAGAQAQPQVQPKKDVGQEGETIVLTPPNLRVGETAQVSCVSFPHPKNTDELIVVGAGSPDLDPGTPQGAGIRVLWKNYAVNCSAYVNKIGPFSPGTYEIRDMTSLYNNDNRREIATRTTFTVR